MNFREVKKFFCGKRVFVTGHTGFKGAWLCLWLEMMGAKVAGFALKAEEESLFNLVELYSVIEESTIGNICDAKKIFDAVAKFQPEILIHMAAQPLVRESYLDPLTTYQTNVIGTLNVFEAARNCQTIKAIVNVTTDKCYENREIDYAYQESDHLGGYDPYSSSKACSEILTASYRRSFFAKVSINIASARAGNVIGGGDFSKDRIIPDIFRSISDDREIELRSPNAIRPWQHVLEPLNGYLMLAKNLYEKGDIFAKAYNFGPNSDSEQNVETLTKKLIKEIGQGSYKINSNSSLHEAGILKLNHSLATKELGWKPKLSFDETINWTAEWYKNYLKNEGDVKKFTLNQINNFLKK